MSGMGDFEPFALGPYRGWVAPGNAAVLVDWFRSNGAGRTVKRGVTRDVILLKGPPAVYVKRLRNEAGLLGRVKSSGTARATREFRNLVFAAAHGIRAPRPVALLVGPADALLATEGLEKFIVLKSLMAGRGLDREERDALIEGLSALVARLAEVGLHHQELDIGHLMISRGLPSQLAIIDLESARELKRSLTREEALRMIVPLVHSFTAFSTAQDALRLVRELGFRDRAEQRAVLTACRTHAAGQAVARARRSVTAGPGFYREDSGSAVIYGNKDFPIEKALEHGRRLMTAPRAKTGKGWELVRTTPEICAKVFLYPGVAGALKRGLRTESAWKSWYHAHLLHAMGIPTIQPLALIQEPDKTALFQEWLAEALPLPDFVRRAFPAWDLGRRREFTRRLARLIRRMHDRGLFHAKLQPGGLLVRERSDRMVEFFVLDLDRLQFRPHGTPRAAAAANLAQLGAAIGGSASRAERGWFLRCYIGWDRELWRKRKEFATEIGRRAKSGSEGGYRLEPGG
jgi:tRNA A-37 threonylcarbamoyl transferase component Bud32